MSSRRMEVRKAEGSTDRAAPPRALRLVWRPAGLFLIDDSGADRPVSAQRCFPWSEPGRYATIRDDDGEEVALVEDVADLDDSSREAVEFALAEAGFVMEVVRVESVEEEFEVRNWKVETRQGPRTFQTKRDEWPREMPGGAYLIRDVAGDLYHVADPDALDRESRERLRAFAG